jgi:hypothetical protein
VPGSQLAKKCVAPDKVTAVLIYNIGVIVKKFGFTKEETMAGTTVNFEERGTYLYVFVVGTPTLAEAKADSLHIFERCFEQGWTNVLIDIRNMPSMPSAMDIFEHASYVARIYREFLDRGMRPVKLAYYGSQNNITPDRFGETVHVNRGLEVKSTMDLAEALAWLGVKS